MQRLHYLATAALLLSACGDRGSVTFNLTAPQSPLFNPVAGPQQVTEYDFRTPNGTVIGIASAVQSSGQSANGKLPLGPLMPAAPEDVYVTALSGGNVLGMARIKDVSIKAGKTVSYDAPLRKPLILVGADVAPEASGTKAAVQLIDPLTSMDLARAPATPVTLSSATAGAGTWDGRYIVIAQNEQLTALDTATGKLAASTLSLSGPPSRIVVAPRDQAIVALVATRGGGEIDIIGDVAAFVGSPSAAAPKVVPLGAAARTAAFSPDGSKLYVLSGGTVAGGIDPCAPGATLKPNSVTTYGLDGTMQANVSLEGFASDLTVDPETGTIVIADVAGRQLATLDPSSGAPSKILGNLTCPSAVRVVDGTVYAITSDHDAATGGFVLQRVPLAGGTSTATPFGGLVFQIPIDSMPSSNGDIGSATLPVRPSTIDAYELAITPDGSRAEFATRAVYNENNTMFMFSQEQCSATLTIVEYGLFALDLRTGNASYQSRSQTVQSPSMGTSCVDCKTGLPSPFPKDQYADCPSTMGDRPAGLAATFGQ